MKTSFRSKVAQTGAKTEIFCNKRVVEEAEKRGSLGRWIWLLYKIKGLFKG